jgi:hypothetical protein
MSNISTEKASRNKLVPARSCTISNMSPTSESPNKTLAERKCGRDHKDASATSGAPCYEFARANVVEFLMKTVDSGVGHPMSAHDVVDGARSRYRGAMLIIADESPEGSRSMQITAIGRDIAKNVFQVHEIDPALRARL